MNWLVLNENFSYRNFCYTLIFIICSHEVSEWFSVTLDEINKANSFIINAYFIAFESFGKKLIFSPMKTSILIFETWITPI